MDYGAVWFQRVDLKTIMIKSKVLSDETSGGINWFFVYSLVLCAAFGKSLITGQAYASPLEVVIWYPLMALSGFLAALHLISFIKRDWPVKYEMKVYLAMILSIIFGLFCSLLPFWGSEAAGMPLTLFQIGGYFLTLGIYPFSAGPDAFLRGLAWGAAVIIAWLLYKEKQSIFDILLIAVSVWLGMSFILILPSLILIITFTAKGLFVAWSNADLVGEFARINLFSYWADGQLLRWFTGFGNQTVNALLLYTGSIIYIWGVFFGLMRNRSVYWKILQGSGFYAFIPLLFMVLYGYQAGLGRQGWIDIDWAAWLVLVCVLLISWLKLLMMVTGFDVKETFLSVFGFLGAMLLGWPVLLAYVGVLLAGYLFGEISKAVQISMRSEVVMMMVLPIFALLTALFARKGLSLEPEALKILGAAIVFAWLYGLIMTGASLRWSRLKVIAVWFAGSLLLWVLAGVFAPVAIMLLAGVVLWLFWQKAVLDKRILPAIVWGTALAVLLLVIWLPRLARPELIPM